MATASSVELARRARALAVQMVARAKASHIGGALSMADLLAVLYTEVLNVRPHDPAWPERDRFLLSKGHACTALYATLALRGFFPVEELEEYGRDGSRLMAHVSHRVPGVEFSTGSLGHALPFGLGLALGARWRAARHRVFVLVSDGELDEGSNWEAILFAPQHGLDNLTLLVDYNRIQSLGAVAEVLDLAPLADKFRAFRWAVREVDGHDHSQLRDALTRLPAEPGRPTVILAHTIKGKGVSYMEDQLLWHYKSPDAAQLAQALAELGDHR
ncbi:MAG: transketolase [Verrucomicrobia bacterium]|jgi:transketolase|nr:transketolase [Verrucomicrobiota bacterium]